MDYETGKYFEILNQKIDKIIELLLEEAPEEDYVNEPGGEGKAATEEDTEEVESEEDFSDQPPLRK